uniref:Uncharacterized protein n=1 Tax=Romanomermis culicivorax TaxID=13658 RepID=A0A915J052_ROMCU
METYLRLKVFSNHLFKDVRPQRRKIDVDDKWLVVPKMPKKLECFDNTDDSYSVLYAKISMTKNFFHEKFYAVRRLKEQDDLEFTFDICYTTKYSYPDRQTQTTFFYNVNTVVFVARFKQ